MQTTSASSYFLDSTRPYRSLSLLFWVWKLLIFSLVLAAPGIGYDTSTTLLPPFFENAYPQSKALYTAVRKLLRWDAVHFTQIASRGYRFEQEWAFGWGFTRTLAFGARAGTAGEGQEVGTVAAGLAGICLSHACHWISVLVLYELTRCVFAQRKKDRRAPAKANRTSTTDVGSNDAEADNFAFLSATLHIISPAGVFLSAPYAEAPFSFLNCLGYYAYARSTQMYGSGRGTFAAVCLFGAGALFGIATMFRGNGFFSGSILIAQALELAYGLTQSLSDRARTIASVKRLLITVASGGLMASIAFLPQVLAYREFCLHPNLSSRPSWCTHRLPSIYAWVQKEYWGVGFLRYWTVSNIPLFLLAAPTLLVLAASCWWSSTSFDPSRSLFKTPSKTKRQDSRLSSALSERIVFYLSLPQLLLVVLAFTTYHVQIIIRLSSGYVVWYWWLASLLEGNSALRICGVDFVVGKLIVKWMVLHALIQAGLFASFLPPA